MNLYSILKVLLISLFFTSFAHSDIRSEFPSYSYVLTEFNVDESFIDNPEFKSFVHQNKREFRKRYKKAVQRGTLIVPTMRDMLYKHDISPLFLYVSMVESDFKTKAVSPTGAAGLWQFTVKTGRDAFDLHVGNTLDERFDPIRSTQSAIKYLYQINNDLGAWYLTTMAYNCGQGCLKKTLKRAGTKDLGVLISSRNSYIKKETKNYIQKVLLMAMIGENYLFNQHDNLGTMVHRINQDSITPVKVRSGESLAHLSNILNMDASYLYKINRHLKNGKVPYRNGYTVNIPTSRVGMFYNQYAQNQSVQAYGQYAYNQSTISYGQYQYTQR